MKGLLFYRDDGKPVMCISEPYFHQGFGETVVVAIVEGEKGLSVESVTMLTTVNENGIDRDKVPEVFKTYAEAVYFRQHY
jgi:hypothetical protein